MQYKFLNIFLDPKEILAQSKTAIDPILLENNESQIEKIYNFYKGNVNLLYVSGYLGTGKAQIVNYSTTFLSTETIILKYNCFNSTILDDILLAFFTEFKRLSAQNIISEPKVKTENFTQKINSYFSQIEKPFVIILDSFEAILDENRQEILDFILHLNSISKIKIIIIGRTFESKYFKDIQLERVMILALEKQLFEKYLKQEKIKYTQGLLDELYRHTRGYYYYTKLSVNLMKKDTSSIFDFLTKLKNSILSFTDFLGKQSLKLIPATERNLFWFLSLVSHSVSIDLLKKINFYDEEKFKFLTENLIITQDGTLVHVQDYLRDEAEDSIAPHIAQKIRQYIIDLYLTQLPLRPLERDICISRQTMRKEIEYQKLFLPKRPKAIESAAVDINIISYGQKMADFGSDFGAKQKQEENTSTKKDEQKINTRDIDLSQRKNVSLNLDNLSFKDIKITKHDENIKQGADKLKNEPPKEEEEIDEFKNLNLIELMQKAQESEEKYNYPKAINIYKKALLLKDDKHYQPNLPLIYTKIADAHEKVANHENAMNYYQLAQEIYENNQDLEYVNQIKYNIAKILFQTYKIENARKIFLEILKSKEAADSLKVKSYLRLANIEEGLSNQYKAFEYYKQALELSNQDMEIDILSELYFKYALALDDKNDLKMAIEYYKKCINLSDDFKINKFISSAYSNIATLYLEKNDMDNALNNYKKAYNIDKQSNNIEGMYYSTSKLASILQRKRPEEALEYFNTALDCAKILNDTFYVVSASLALGDYLYDRRQNEIALKHYVYALNLAKNSFSQDNINKINIRINDIKFRLGPEKFEELMEIIREQENE